MYELGITRKGEDEYGNEGLWIFAPKVPSEDCEFCDYFVYGYCGWGLFDDRNPYDCAEFYEKNRG